MAGFFTVHLAEAVYRGQVIATDLRSDRLAIAARRAKAQSNTNVETRTVSADDPALLPGSIDLALLCQVDHLLPDRARYFAKLIPALRPGGRIVVANFCIYYHANLIAAKAASLTETDYWSPSPNFFLLVLS